MTLEPPKLGVVEWAEGNLKLSERITNKPGSYLTSRTPYVREVLECFADDIEDHGHHRGHGLQVGQRPCALSLGHAVHAFG